MIANSIGAYFAMHTLQACNIEKALFISPVLDMERLILDMMSWANVSETDLHEKVEIPTDFGETLSWKYLCFVRENPIIWNIPTEILYAGNDNLVSRKTVFIANLAIHSAWSKHTYIYFFFWHFHSCSPLSATSEFFVVSLSKKSEFILLPFSSRHLKRRVVHLYETNVPHFPLQ